jgi:CRP-like cAMP-binding protein
MLKKLKVDHNVAELLNRTLKLEGFFPEFREEHVEKIFLRSGLYFYPKGASVVEQESHGRDLYVIERGNLGVFRQVDGTNKCVANLKDGDIFGEIGLLRGGVRIASVTAQEDSKVFHIVYADIQYLLKHNHALGEHLDHLAKERLKTG